MTAYGDEATAVEALEAGAASYVPKAQKAERLISAVERVIAYTMASRRSEHLARCTLEFHCRYAVPNDRRMIHDLVAQIQQTMAGMEYGDTVERIRASEALEEALLNAMYHGNLEINKDELSAVRAELDDSLLDRLIEERCRDQRIADREIYVVVHLVDGEARFVIRDQGRGFDRSYVGGAASPDRFAAGQFRGMTLIRALMDHVSFNDAGNELVMHKLMPVPAAKRQLRHTS